MKICHYVPHGAVPDVRGFAPAIAAQNFAKFLKEDTYVISALENHQKLHEDTKYGDVYRIKQGFLYKRLFTKMTRLDPYPLHARAARIVRENPVNIFHAHQLEFPVNEFRKIVAPDTKIVVHAHVTRTFDPKWGKADAYIAVSEYIKNRLIERGFDADLVHVIPNGVDTDFFMPFDSAKKNALKRQYNFPQDAKIISFVGRKQEIKGYDIFLDVADRALKNSTNVFFLAVGAEPMDAKKEATYSRRQKIRNSLLQSGRYIELDAMRHEQIPEIFNISDVMLLPSIAETQGMAIVEAMSCACPVISSDGSAIVESIDDGIDGFLIKDRGDITGIVSLLGVVIENGESIAVQARQKILNKFAWRKVTNELVDVYKCILS